MAVRFEHSIEQIWRLDPDRHLDLPITYFTETLYGLVRYTQPGDDGDRRTAKSNFDRNGLQYNSYGEKLNPGNGYAGNTQILCFRLELTEQENIFEDTGTWFPLVQQRRSDKHPTDQYYAFSNNKNPGGGSPTTNEEIMNQWGSNIICYKSIGERDISRRLIYNEIFGQDIFTVFEKWRTYYKPVAAKAVIEESQMQDIGNRAAMASFYLQDRKFIGLSECPWIVLMAYIGGLDIETEVILHKFFVFYGAPTENIIVCWALLLAYAFGVKKKGNKLVGPGVILISIVKNGMPQVVQEIRRLVTERKIRNESVVGVLIDGHITLLYVSTEGLGFVELQGLYVRLITYDQDWGRYYSRFVGAPRGAGGNGIISAQLICVENKDNFRGRRRGGGKINGNKKINIKNNNIISKQYGGYDVNYRKNRTKGDGWPTLQVIQYIIRPYLENVGMRNQSIYNLFEYINGNADVVRLLNKYSLIELLGICMNAINGISGIPTPLPNSENSEAYNIGGIIELLSIYGPGATLIEGFKLFVDTIYSYIFGREPLGEKTVDEYVKEYEALPPHQKTETRRGIEISTLRGVLNEENHIRSNVDVGEMEFAKQVENVIDRGWKLPDYPVPEETDMGALQENVIPQGEALYKAKVAEIKFWGKKIKFLGEKLIFPPKLILLVDEVTAELINNAKYLMVRKQFDDAFINIEEALTIYKIILEKFDMPNPSINSKWTRHTPKSEYDRLRKEVEYLQNVKVEAFENGLKEIIELINMIDKRSRRTGRNSPYGGMGRRSRQGRKGYPNGGGRPKKIKKRNNKKKSINKKHKTKIKLSKKRKSIKRKSIKKRKYKKTIKK